MFIITARTCALLAAVCCWRGFHRLGNLWKTLATLFRLGIVIELWRHGLDLQLVLS